MKLLVIEDETKLAEYLQKGLGEEGFVVDAAHNGIDGLHLATEQPYDLIILDGMLPGIDGLAVLAALRQSRQTPVLMLTARAQVEDRVKGLQAGADDYLVKPIDLDELAARIRALTRRMAGRSAPVLTHGELTLDPAGRQVTLAGQPVELSNREFSLLQMLLEGAGRVLTRTQLEQSLYGWRDEPDSNALEVHIHHLRKKLGSDLIRTLRGVGYTIAKP